MASRTSFGLGAMPVGSRLALRQSCAVTAMAPPRNNTASKAYPARLRDFIAVLAAVDPAQHVFLHAEALPFGREGAGAHVGRIARDGRLDRRARLGVALDERRRESREQADDVVEHQHLPIAIGSRADSDRGNGEAF